MGFRLVPKSVTLNDPERRNGRVVCVISPNSVPLHCVNWLKIHRDILRVKCSPKNSFQRYIIYGNIRRGSPQRGRYSEAPSYR